MSRPLGALPDPGRPLDLAYDQKMVTFSFAALDYTSPKDNRYAYRMEGFDNGWIDAGTEYRATYTNLPAGDYVLRVRAANADGIWSPVDLEIPIHVAPAPWNTTAARMAYLLVATLALGYILRLKSLRHDRQLRYRRELQRTVRERTSELKWALNRAARREERRAAGPSRSRQYRGSIASENHCRRPEMSAPVMLNGGYRADPMSPVGTIRPVDEVCVLARGPS